MSEIRQHLLSLPHNLDWVETYLEFIENAPAVDDKFDRHHILMSSLFPQFRSLTKFPWNQKDLSYADHLIAHYMLRKAIPCAFTNAAFRLMIGLRYKELVASDYDEELLSDIATEYELIRRENDFSIEGCIKIYREEEITVCLPGDLPKYTAEGWTTVYPEQQWIFKGDEECRILKSKLPEFLLEGWEVGRTYVPSEGQRAKVKLRSLAYHQKMRAQETPYSYIPRGDFHHRRVFGISEETRRKISITLTGVPLSLERAAKVRAAALGKHWEWSEASRQAKSLSMRGKLHPFFGKSSPMKGKTQSLESRNKMSESHKQRYADNPEAFFLNKPRGEDHFAFGKERPEDTRAKISASLTGKKQSDATKLLRARKLSLAKFPELTPEQTNLLSEYVVADGAARAILYKQIRGAARPIANGLDYFIDDVWQTTKSKNWRTARVWLFCKSGLSSEFLSTRFPVLYRMEKTEYPV